jgi:hypothetical protein
MIGPIEKRIRKLRKDFLLATGWENLENAVLFMSKDVWDAYVIESELRIIQALPENITFEGVETRVMLDAPEIKDLICYLPRGASARL